jgi:hypothetical protein
VAVELLLLPRGTSAADHAVFGEDVLRTIEKFRAELDSSRFDERRLDLER